MVLHHHLNSDDLERILIAKHNNLTKKTRERINANNSSYTNSNYEISLSKYSIPEKGLGSKNAYQLIHDELTLDGNPTLNLASFVNTFVEPEAKDLLLENITKNLADSDEYPALMEIHSRCISMLADLWHAPKETKKQIQEKYVVFDRDAELEIKNNTSIGTATVGSSEAIMLGGLALKKNWQAKRRAEGKSTEKPNIVMGANAQVALEKFARYFDVECRLIPVSKESQYVLDLSKIKDNIDENTIGVFVILGSTYTGTFEDVQGVSDILDEVEKETGLDIPIHVDGASGAFVAPFTYPNLRWDFRLPRVHSINTSGHKFGLTAAGLGWVLWRKAKYLPDELKFELSYLGGSEESFTLNFSRPGHEVIHQFYNFVSMGRKGYFDYFNFLMENARLLSDFLEETNYYECVSIIHRPKGVFELQNGDDREGTPIEPERSNDFHNVGLPVVAFKFTEDFKKKYPEIPQAIVSTLLRIKGYIVPNYPLPPSVETVEILRVVVRQNLSHALLDKLMADIVEVTENLITASKLIAKTTATESKEAKSDNVQVIHDMLLSIASSGIKNKEIFDKTKNKPAKKRHHHNHKTYRGTC